MVRSAWRPGMSRPAACSQPTAHAAEVVSITRASAGETSPRSTSQAASCRGERSGAEPRPSVPMATRMPASRSWRTGARRPEISAAVRGQTTTAARLRWRASLANAVWSRNDAWMNAARGARHASDTQSAAVSRRGAGDGQAARPSSSWRKAPPCVWMSSCYSRLSARCTATGSRRLAAIRSSSTAREARTE